MFSSFEVSVRPAARAGQAPARAQTPMASAKPCARGILVDRFPQQMDTACPAVMYLCAAS